MNDTKKFITEWHNSHEKKKKAKPEKNKQKKKQEKKRKKDKVKQRKGSNPNLNGMCYLMYLKFPPQGSIASHNHEYYYCRGNESFAW